MPSDVEAPGAVPVKPAESRASKLLTVGTLAAVVVVALVTIIVILAVPVTSGSGSSGSLVQGYTTPASASGDWRAQLLALVNQARADNNAAALCYSDKLNSASQSQSDSGVYGHTWVYVTAVNYGYSSLGQNIATGQTTVQQVFNAWFNEIAPNDGHRRNILNPTFTQMGAGWTTSNNLWTQNFGSSTSEPCA